MLQRLQQALGGADKLAAVKDLEYHAEVEIQTPGATMKVKQTNSFLAPSTMRQDIELPFAKQSVYSNGASGWLATMQGARDLSGPILKQVQGEIFRQLVALALSDRDASRTVNAAAAGKLDISTKDGESVQLTLDEKTGLPTTLAYKQSPAEGGKGVEQQFADWRDAGGGVRLPFQWTVLQDGQKFATVTVEDYKVNSGLTEEVLSKKP